MNRWLGYWANIEQPIPCYPGGQLFHPAVANMIDPSGETPLLPTGYLQYDDGATGIRSSWTAASTVIGVVTWLTSCVLKYTGMEMMARGWAAAAIKEQVRVCIQCQLVSSLRESEYCCVESCIGCRSRIPLVRHISTRHRRRGPL